MVKSDDTIWFTDPPFGILGNYEGHVATPELPTNVYRLDTKTGRATVVAGDINRPNGLAFSPDESRMYIVEAGVTPRVIRLYDVVDNEAKLANGRPFLTAEPGGTPDGFRLDVDGNIWCGWGMGNEKRDGVRIFDPTGKPIGFIALPERCEPDSRRVIEPSMFPRCIKFGRSRRTTCHHGHCAGLVSP